MTKTASATDSIEETISEGLGKGVQRLREFEYEVHLRTKRFQRKLAALSVAILVGILGVGLYALAAYNAFLEVTTPPLAAFYTGTALFVLCGLFGYGATHKKVLGLGLKKTKS